MKYGYCRVSTKKQSIERQIRNIKEFDDTAHIVTEAYTGTSLNRPEWNKIYKNLRPNDWVIFDSVSRMSRNAEEGFALYKELFEKGIELVFLNERHIDTSSYKKALDGTVSVMVSTGDKGTDKLVNTMISAVNEFIMHKVEMDIRIAFEQSQKEVDDLHKRTQEGIKTAKLNGKQIGTPKRTTLHIKKEAEAIPLIIKHSKDFNGTLTDIDCMKIIGIANNTYYKYKNKIKRKMERKEFGMKFIKKEDLPLTTRKMIEKEDYVGYVRAYYRGGHYGSRLFFNGERGTIDQINEAEERGKKRYTSELKTAVQSVCEFLFDDNNPNGRYQLYDFCEANGFEKNEYGYIGYCYMAHSAFQIVVRTDDDYFCRVYFWDRKDEEEFLGEIAG